MTGNSIKAENGIEVYADDIQRIADEYVEGLSEDEEERVELMKKTPVFRGLLKHIYMSLFKITDKDVKYNNKNSRLDYSNAELLDSVWDIFTALCYKYAKNPTLLNFSLMTGISVDSFNSWKNGEYRDLTTHPETIKRWMRECEAAAYDLALSGNPGGMFALKCNYGYRETGYTNEQNNQSLELETPRQIAQRRAGDKPDFPAVIE